MSALYNFLLQIITTISLKLGKKFNKFLKLTVTLCCTVTMYTAEKEEITPNEKRRHHNSISRCTIF